MTAPAWSDHLLVAPVLLPLATAALLLMLGEQRRTARAAMSAMLSVPVTP
jgi:multicomponent K+:H+ antiporter subunit D